MRGGESLNLPLDVHQWRVIVHDSMGDQLVKLRDENERSQRRVEKRWRGVLRESRREQGRTPIK